MGRGRQTAVNVPVVSAHMLLGGSRRTVSSARPVKHVHTKQGGGRPTAFCALRPNGALTWRSVLNAWTSTSAITPSNGRRTVFCALPIWRVKPILLSMCGGTALTVGGCDTRRRRQPKQPLRGREELGPAVPGRRTRVGRRRPQPRPRPRQPRRPRRHL